MKILVTDKNEIMLEMQRQLIFQYRMALSSANEKVNNKQYELARNYEQGWKDATRKIVNFIDRHCREYE